MKKKAIAIMIIIVFLLFLPIPTGQMKDGGTRVYSALTYKVVIWQRFVDTTEEDAGEGLVKYQHTSVYWLPDNFKTIDELWEIERTSR